MVALDRRPFDPCQQVRALLARAAWLDRSGKTLDAAVVPLVETRAWAVVRRGHMGLAVDWDGGLVLAGVREGRP